MKPASLISVIILALIALLHAARLVSGSEITVDGRRVPLWASVVAVVIAAALAWALWRERKAGSAERLEADTEKLGAVSESFSSEEDARSALLPQLQTAAALRSAEDQVLWTIFGVFWAANAILLVALFTSSDLAPRTVIAVVATVGTALSLVWHWIQARALGHVRRYERLMKRIEREIGIPEAFSVARIPDKDYEELLGSRLRARKVMHWCSFIASAAWGVTLIVVLVVSLISFF